MVRRGLGEEFIEDTEAIKRGLNDFLRSLSRLEPAILIRAGITLVVLIVLGVGLHLLFGLFNPDLEARVRATSTRVGIVIMVNNTGNSDWNKVKMILNEKYTYEADKIEAGGSLTITVESFTKGGKAAPKNLTPKVLLVECDKGKSVFTLN